MSLRDRSALFGRTVSRTGNNVTEIAPNMLTPMHVIIVMSTTSLASATCVCSSLQWPIQRRGLRNPVAAETSHCVAARDAQHPRSTQKKLLVATAHCYRVKVGTIIVATLQQRSEDDGPAVATPCM